MIGSVRRCLALAALTLTWSLAACGAGHNSLGPVATVNSAPSGFVVRPGFADPLCNGGRGVRLRPGLPGDAVVASATMPDGSTWIAYSEIFPGKRVAVLRSVTPQCAPDPQFGHGGEAAISISASLKIRHPSPGPPAHGLWIDAVAPSNNGGAIVAGTYGGEWVVAEVDRSGRLDPKFGNGGWSLVPFRGEVTAVVQEQSGRLLIAGDNDGGGCCTLNWAAALSPLGQLDSRFGSHGRAALPTGTDSGVHSLALEPNGDILAVVGYGNMGCWGTALAMLEPSGQPVPLFRKRLDRFWHKLGFGAFIGNVHVDDRGFTLVGTGQKPCAEYRPVSPPPATGLIARFRTDGQAASHPVRFPSRMYGTVDAFREGEDTFAVESLYADATHLAVSALRPDGSLDRRFGNGGRARIRTPWRGFSARLDTQVSVTEAGPGAIVVLATRPGGLQIIRLRF
jgi:hypothetical protein